MPVRVSDGILVFEVSTAPGGLVPVTREVTVRDERAPDAKLAQHRVSLRRKAFANPFRRAIGRVLVQILLSVCICLARRLSRFQAAKTAVQIPGAVVACPVSGLRLNCCFLIFSANSMPRIVTAAVSNRLNPSIGRTRCFIRRWSCSMTLFKYLQERIHTRRGKVPAAFNLATARCEAAYPSKVIGRNRFRFIEAQGRRDEAAIGERCPDGRQEVGSEPRLNRKL